MATHSSVLAWRIPGTAEPGGLPSVGQHRVGHDWSDLAVAAAALVYPPVNFRISLYGYTALHFSLRCTIGWLQSYFLSGAVRNTGAFSSCLLVHMFTHFSRGCSQKYPTSTFTDNAKLFSKVLAAIPAPPRSVVYFLLFLCLN